MAVSQWSSHHYGVLICQKSTVAALCFMVRTRNFKIWITTFDLINSFGSCKIGFDSSNSKTNPLLLKGIRQNIAGWCKQTFCIQKFVDNVQQYFALCPQVNFSANDLHFHWCDQIQATFYLFFSTLQPETPQSCSVLFLQCSLATSRITN